MKPQRTVGMMLYCAEGDDKSVFTLEKYKGLAEGFVDSGFEVQTVLYNDSRAEELRESLLGLNALLVWVNPIEQGNDRKILDELLAYLANSGVFISSLPETIQKIGTKRVLFDTRQLEFGSDVRMYSTLDQFQNEFPAAIADGRSRVLKQFRGNGGDGVFKVKLLASGKLSLLHAKRGSTEQTLALDEFFDEFRPYFAQDRPLLDQEWNDNIANGMVRCYLSGKQVAGFGYQEINALYPQDGPVVPGKRFYFTEKCALFEDLRQRMEDRWIDELLEVTGLAPERLPVIWDADFFINSLVPNSAGRYTLCEINVSSVSPFPESAIRFIVSAVKQVTASRA